MQSGAISAPENDVGKPGDGRQGMRLAAIAVLLLAGILAGTQLGKIAPLVGWYRDDIGF